MNRKLFASLAFIGSLFGGGTSWAEDWPQWNGPHRDGMIREPGLPTTLESQGLQENWSAPIAGGYSGPSIANGRVFVSDYQRREGNSTNNAGGRDALKGTERVVCLDAATGRELWTHAYDRDYLISYAAGPRATPTVDGDRVYSLGAEGDLVCLDVKQGQLIWKRQLRDEYKTETPIWGYASAPLVVDDLLITLAGGPGSTVVALDKKTGDEKWRSLSASNIGYAPPTMIESGGDSQMLIWDADAISSLDPKTGKVLWSTPLKPSYDMSIMSPVVHGTKLFASGIGGVSGMFEVLPNKGGLEPLWKGTPKNSVYCSNSTPIFDGEYLYGNDCEHGTLICVRASDGTRMWETAVPTTNTKRAGRHATVFISKMGPVYYLFSETGDFIIAELSPKEYVEKGRMHVIEPTNECFGRQVVWSYPAYANGNLYVRNDEVLKSYRLK